MKAIIIETGETIDFKGSSTEFGDMTWIDSDGVLHQGHIKGGVKILEQGKEIDWEQRRYEIAKEEFCALTSVLPHFEVSKDIWKGMLKHSVAMADALIEELKKK